MCGSTITITSAARAAYLGQAATCVTAACAVRDEGNPGQSRDEPAKRQRFLHKYQDNKRGDPKRVITPPTKSNSIKAQHQPIQDTLVQPQPISASEYSKPLGMSLRTR